MVEYPYRMCSARRINNEKGEKRMVHPCSVRTSLLRTEKQMPSVGGVLPAQDSSSEKSETSLENLSTVPP